MSGQGSSLVGSVRAHCGDAAEPNLKRRRLLDAGGAIQDDETAKQKMRDAKVKEEVGGRFAITGFDPEGFCQKRRVYYNHSSLVTPMSYFVQQGDLPMMRWLYVNGADTRDEDVDFWFPMYGAAVRGKFEACRWLYERGAANDIKRRTSNDTSPLSVAFTFCRRQDLGRWLILNGALCKDDDSGELDLGLVKKDLNDCEECIDERQTLLEWANELQQDREAFFVFLMGILFHPKYSPSALRKLLSQRLLSEKATDQILGLLPADQNHQLWDNLVCETHRSCPANGLVGASGVLEVIADYVGIVRGREARIIRQLTEILPDLNAELDQKYESDSSDEEDESDSSEEDE